ncbi:MAG: SDR family oxidoreductase [Dehalococcoidales bacterium]|nr:SDR family oxidoreductase [Dehalococcoidales bacterium]
MMLSGKVAIVTGAAKGIGRGIALRYASEGCAVTIADINAEAAKKTLEDIEKKGGKGLAIKCDVTNSSQVRAVVEQTNARFGPVDILVNNAGGLPSRFPVDEMPEEEWDKVVALNMRGGFLFCKYVVPQMKQRKSGRIINISSLGATSPPTSNFHYHAGKAGVLGMTVDLAVDLAPYGICVNAIIPGPIRTEFFGDLVNDDKFFTEFGKTVPLQRAGTPDDIAGTALFFASDLASWITGEALRVSGGLPLSPMRQPAKD